MTEFKPLGLEDRELFLNYMGEYDFYTYEYSFLTLYLWRKMCNTEFCIMDGTLIIRKSGKCAGSYFMQPVGYKKENLKDIALKLNDLRKSSKEYKNLFRDIESPFLEELKECFNGRLAYHEDTDNFDYIYDTEKLISLSGKKYHRKKNQYNHFISNYNYEVRDINSLKVIEDCIGFARDWYEKREEDSIQLKFEMENTEDILKNAELLNIKGIAVYVDGTIAGFSVGEIVNRNMAIVHIEKGNLEYSGIYSFINKAMAEKYFSRVSLVNRQEDLGLEGLRKAKMAYNPSKLEKKYIVDLIEDGGL